MIKEFVSTVLSDPQNNVFKHQVSEDDNLIGYKIIDSPIIGYADANDKIFDDFEKIIK